MNLRKDHYRLPSGASRGLCDAKDDDEGLRMDASPSETDLMKATHVSSGVKPRLDRRCGTDGTSGGWTASVGHCVSDAQGCRFRRPQSVAVSSLSDTGPPLRRLAGVRTASGAYSGRLPLGFDRMEQAYCQA